MIEMFFHCESLPSINISNFKTPNLKSMAGMFDSNYVLTSIDLTNFDTSQVTNMRYMFCHDFLLAHINVSTFNTKLVTTMESMFGDCTALTSIDLSNFNTSKVSIMKLMFYNCQTLKVLNLSSFETTSLTNLETMLGACYNLEYIDFKLYHEVTNFVFGGILSGIRENIVICIDENKTVTDFKAIIETKLCYKIYCSDNWKKHVRRYDPITQTCPEVIETTNIVSTDINNIETSNIPSTNQNEEGKSADTTNIISSDINNIETSNIPSTNQNEEGKSADTTNIISTYNELESKDYSTYVPTSDIMSSLVNENIIKTSNKNSIISSGLLSNLINDDSTEEISNIYLFNITGENNEVIYQNIIKNILQIFITSRAEEYLLDGLNNYIYQISTTKNEKEILAGNKNSTNPLSQIDLGECEYLLKNFYNIDRNKSLIIVKYEKITNNSLEREIQYEVYNPTNKKKLNLSICDNTTIDIYTPVLLSEELLNLYNMLKEKGYDLFDINSDFYKDICTPFTSPEGTDVLLSDRIKYYFNNSETLCQSNCRYPNSL